MRSYSETDVFSAQQITHFRRAEGLVATLPNVFGLRCHELARAVGAVLNLPFVDGMYGPVEHSWLFYQPASPLPRTRAILDVYCVGRLPQVQILDTMLSLASLYVAGDPRTDIDEKLVLELTDLLRGAER